MLPIPDPFPHFPLLHPSFPFPLFYPLSSSFFFFPYPLLSFPSFSTFLYLHLPIYTVFVYMCVCMCLYVCLLPPFSSLSTLCFLPILSTSFLLTFISSLPYFLFYFLPLFPSLSLFSSLCLCLSVRVCVFLSLFPFPPFAPPLSPSLLAFLIFVLIPTRSLPLSSSPLSSIPDPRSPISLPLPPLLLFSPLPCSPPLFPSSPNSFPYSPTALSSALSFPSFCCFRPISVSSPLCLCILFSRVYLVCRFFSFFLLLVLFCSCFPVFPPSFPRFLHSPSSQIPLPWGFRHAQSSLLQSSSPVISFACIRKFLFLVRPTLLSVYISACLSRPCPRPSVFFLPPPLFNSTMQFSLNLLTLALALVSVATPSPVDIAARPTHMPGPIVPDDSFDGYNPSV